MYNISVVGIHKPGMGLPLLHIIIFILSVTGVCRAVGSQNRPWDWWWWATATATTVRDSGFVEPRNSLRSSYCVHFSRAGRASYNTTLHNRL